MTDLSELTARVRRLEDLEAVRATWLEYCNRLDAEDFAGLGAVFTEDARLAVVGLSAGLDGTYSGRRAIVEDFYARTGTSSGDGAGAMTGHLSTNMQIELAGDEATTLAYFFEIVDDDLVLIGTYQHRMRRDTDRWRIAVLHISVRYRARLQAERVRGRSLREILGRPV
ncbi:MAG: nuclear transport factor 2 family protein [Acidimicrobiales bacterium]|nr:nuclear transport factor 2 family protein [Acidimicrobiales bacterium]